MKAFKEWVSKGVVYLIPPLIVSTVLILGLWVILPHRLIAVRAIPNLEEILPALPEAIDSTDSYLQAISFIGEKAIASANSTLNAMTNFITVLVTIALATIGASAVRLKQSSDEIQDLKKGNEDIRKLAKDLEGELDKSHDAIMALSTRYLNLQQEMLTLPQKILPYKMAVEALKKGEISIADFEESQVWHSWQKWVVMGDETGYEEMVHHKINADGLPVSIRLSAITELDKVERKCRTPGAANSKDFGFKAKLLTLLNINQEE